uniref:Uncharacterized protein n=1 Tax=Knipowitschia caucasica TaxID=637954 RepID=A0AAV2LCW5_KNICA
MSTLTENTPDPSKNSPTAKERGDEANTPVRRRGTGVSFPQDSSTQPPPEPTTSSPGPSQREPRSELRDRTDADPPPALQANFDLEPATDSDTDEEEGSQVYKIEKHKVTNRTKEDWSLRVTRPVLILGDSNVARIKDQTFPFLQIDSVPGANLLHATELLRNTPNQPQVESVVLSFGLNNRQQKQSETGIKQMQSLIREAKKTFPNANIRVPLIQTSRELPPKERDGPCFSNFSMFIGPEEEFPTLVRCKGK